MLFTASTYSQTVINTKQCRVGTWDAIKESWSYGPWKKADITFKANSDGVISDDQAKSTYTFTTSRQTTRGVTRDGEKYTSYDWTCFDEKSRTCKFMIVMYEEGAKVAVIYSDIVFEYSF